MSDTVLPPIPADHYESLLTDMSTALDTLGLAAQPLTSAALHTDPLLSPLVGRVLAQHAADAVASAIANSRPDVQQILQQDDAHKLHPQAKRALEWIATLPTCAAGSADRVELEEELVKTVQTFLKDALATHAVEEEEEKDKAAQEGVLDQGEEAKSKQGEQPSMSSTETPTPAPATTGDNDKRSPALLPAHALPLFYLMRPVLLSHLWPRSVMGPVLSGERKDVLPLVEQDMERVLSNAYVNISVQTHLLALYGGSVEFLAMLVAGEEGDQEEEGHDDDDKQVDEVADRVKVMNVGTEKMAEKEEPGRTDRVDEPEAVAALP